LENISRVSVYVGIIDRVNGPAVWGITITDKSSMILHESYNSGNLANDIALIRLVNTIVSDPNVGIVSLPLRTDVSVALEGKLATIAGFGKYSDTSGPSPFLRYVTQPIVSNANCEKVFGKANVRDTNICLETTGGRSSCQGY
jgi:chymotrypsin